MKQFLVALILVGLVTCATARSANAETKTGEAKFTPGGKEFVDVTLGDKLKLDARFQPITVGALNAISVKANIKNTTTSKLYYAYFVAFMDKDKNLIGCQAFPLFIDGAKTGGAGTFIQLPPGEISRIAYYSVTFYESDKQIGSK